MRKLLFTLSLMLLLTIVARSQAPSFINYQGTARNSVGNALVNKPISLRLSVQDGVVGNVVYRETRQVTTNAFGLFSVQIGDGNATSVSGSLLTTNWAVGAKWIQVEIDPEGGTQFKNLGNTRLTSVPYALYTNLSGDIVLPFNKSQNENGTLFKLTNTGNNGGSLAIEGQSNSTAPNVSAIRGTIASSAAGSFSAAVLGQNNGTSSNGIGVYGRQEGSGWGVYGTTPGGVGVYGNSTTGTGVYGQSVSGSSVMGFQPSNGTGSAGRFQNTGIANGAAVVLAESSAGASDGVLSNMSGFGKAGSFNIINATNTVAALEVKTNGLGNTGVFQNTNAANATPNLISNSNGVGDGLQVLMTGIGKAGTFTISNTVNNANVLEAITNGLGRSALFQNTNAANTAPNVSALTNGSGDALQSIMTGTGKAGTFTINNAANTNFAVDAFSNGTNNVINSTNTGTGRAGFFQVNNAASTADALSAVTNGTGASWALRGTSTGTNGAGLFIQSNVANTANNVQSNQAGLGRSALFNASNVANTANALEVNAAGLGKAAFLNATNSANTSNAFEVNTAGTGFAANISSSNATPKALKTVGAVQLTGIGEGANRILMTDVSGNANWNSMASVGGVSGTGTLNRVAKWTPNGTFVGNSQIFDDGTNVGVGTDIPTAKLFVNGNFIDSATTTNFAATFINNDNGTGDGIKIKLGRAKSVYSPPSISNLISDDQMVKIKNLISCDFTTSQKITLLGTIAADGILDDLKVVGGLAVSAGNYIIDFINSKLSLPIKLGPLSVPKVDFPKLDLPSIHIDVPVIPTFDIPGFTITNGFNLLPATQILPEFTAMPKIPNIDLSGIGIDPIDIGSVSFWGVPDLCLTDVVGSSPMNNSNEFIRFTDKNDAKMGSIRAVSVTNWATNYLNPAFMYKLYGALTSSKADKFHAQYHFKNELLIALKDYASLGVEYASGNGDYAEWLERTDTKELITPGDIVAVIGGRITKELECAEQVMVVSHNPIVLGNTPKEGKNIDGNNIAFMGQVPVKVMGPVATGDYIVGQFNTPGYGIAKHPNEMNIEDFKYAVGRSWDENLSDGPKMVNTVVGVHNGDYLKILKSFETKFNDSESRLKTLESKVDELIKTQSSTSTKKSF